MIRIRNQNLGIDQGEVVLFSDFDAGGPMWAEAGPREVRKEIAFNEAFRSLPVVSFSLSMWDINSAENARGDLSIENVTNHGFVMVFKTWGDTKVARMRAAWTAMGELGYADDWDLDV